MAEQSAAPPSSFQTVDFMENTPAKALPGKVSINIVCSKV